MPDRRLPKRLVIKELRKGDGRVAEVGDEVAVRYVGRRWDGQSYSNTWLWDEAPRYTIGAHEINPGLDLTLRGMREGGRREVIIPLHLLYYPEERHGPLSAENAEVVIIDLFHVSKRSEPVLAEPDGEPPDRLVVNDLQQGGGEAARAGDDVVLNYKGINWDGSSHGSSWTFPDPPEFRIGGRRLYLGIDFGIRGMKEGGRRELRIPPRLGFERGVEPWGPLGPEDSLLYIVDLVEVTKGGA